MTAPRLPDRIRSLVDYDLARPTRVHPLTTPDGKPFWIKREDELSSGVCGSKLRKYASLIPRLQEEGIEVAGIVGGPNSNNLVGLVQMLLERGIGVEAFVRKPSDPELKGNSLLLSLLLENQRRHFVSHRDWAQVDSLAAAFLRTAYPRLKTKVIAEGGYGLDALPGALTLAEDLARNETEKGLEFSQVYIDSGTGMTAIGVILGMELLLGRNRDREREVVICHLAGSSDAFCKKLGDMRAALKTICGASDSLNAVRIRHITPPTAKKFGHVNASILKSCQAIASSLGLLMDPVYSVKHYMAFVSDLESQPQKAAPLFVFNGSPLGIMGFQTTLSSLAGR